MVVPHVIGFIYVNCNFRLLSMSPSGKFEFVRFYGFWVGKTEMESGESCVR